MESRHFAKLAALLLSATLAACGGSPSAGSSSPLGDLDLAAGTDVTPPAAPANLTWSADGMTVTMTWGASTDDVGVIGYDFYYGDYFIGSTSGTTATLIGFKSGTPYNFTVKARDAAGNVSLASNQITVLLGIMPDTTPPTTPTNVRTTNVAQTSVTLSWTASQDDVAVVVYQIYSGAALAGTALGSTSATIANLTPSTTYVLTVVASDAAGNLSPASAPLTVTTLPGNDTTPPTAPTNLTASNVTDSSATFAWNASSDNLGVTSYTLYNGTAPAATTAGLSASVSGLTPGNTYSFTVRANDAAGNASAPSNAVTVTTIGSYSISVTKAGTGSGTVISSPAGINCGSVCGADFAGGTSVTLTASADGGSTFTGWGGACSGTGACTLMMTALRLVTANFDGITPQSISINAGGPAAGSFVADNYFSGGTTYSNTATIDTSALGASAPPVAVFQTERYGESTYTIPSLTAGGAYTVTLYFEESYLSAAGQRLFDVVINGATVLSAFDIYAAAGGQNKAVARSFNASASGSGQMVIQFTKGTAGVENPKICGITVAPGSLPTYTLTVNKAGAGSGTVAGGGINCGATCTASVTAGTSVSLTATPASGSGFGSWSGGATGSANPVTVLMDGNKTVTANFTLGTTYTLTIATSGNGTTNPAAGTYTYNANTNVSVTATPAAGYSFTGWSGAATGTANPASITMNGNKTLTASFSGGDTCQKGTTQGKDVAVIGESFIAMSHGITQQIEKDARAAGSLGASDRYVDNSVSGTTLANNQIPSQYTKAVQSSGTIKYVLMDGGGNDCLINNNGDAAYTAAQQLFQTMAQKGTQKVVYFFYPDPVGSGYGSLKSCLDALRPKMKSLCDGLTSPKCYWLDLRPLWNGHPEYTSDGIHPTTAGSTVTGDAIWQTMVTNCVAQ